MQDVIDQILDSAQTVVDPTDTSEFSELLNGVCTICGVPELASRIRIRFLSQECPGRRGLWLTISTSVHSASDPIYAELTVADALWV